MRGVGTARAAISIVNALPLGIGAAVGIEWPVRATARLAPDEAGDGRITVEPAGAGTAIVRTAARTSLERFVARRVGRLRLTIRSTLPVARGLKSSSAVSSSVAAATARAGGAEPDPMEVARLTAEVGRLTGLSATGAFDDAVAGLLPGGVVTDNRHDRRLRSLSVDSGLAVALWVPRGTHPRSPAVHERFRRDRRLAERAAEAALDGDWATAMRANSELVEKVMGYRYAGLHDAVASAGAVAAGVSGLGPAFAALAPRRSVAKVLRALPRTGQRRSVRLFLANGGPTEAVS